MQIGVTIPYRANTVILDELKKAKEIGLQSCQLSIWDMSLYTDEKAAEINAAVAETGITISTLWCGYSGPVEWNFTYGPMVNGLVPPAYRFLREKELLLGSEFAMKLGVNQIATHVGFLPENYYDADFRGTVASIKKICTVLKERNQWFLFETGQETPVTLLRAIGDIGTGNLGVNLDTANLILYGKGNPVDALDVFGQYVMDLHIKDGLFPTDGWKLGEEVAVGEGKADFPRLIAKLKELGYDGALTIEREISGEKQIEDIVKAKALLEQYI